jgi:hypothetical protein
MTTRTEPDYARDRIWEKDPGNADSCVSYLHDPYLAYIFGSDGIGASFSPYDDVRYC